MNYGNGPETPVQAMDELFKLTQRELDERGIEFAPFAGLRKALKNLRAGENGHEAELQPIYNTELSQETGR